MSNQVNGLGQNPKKTVSTNIKQNYSELLFKTIKSFGVDHVFMVTGGGAMALNEAANNHLNSVFLNHEQSCAMAATAYGKSPERPFGVCVVTSGCGVTNAMTGLLDAYQDGVPVLFISGNANSDQIHKENQRHYGVQDLMAIELVQNLCVGVFKATKKDKPVDLICQAVELMLGRKGPVWIDVPLDVQMFNLKDKEITKRKINETYESVKWVENNFENPENITMKCKRPLLLIGQGAPKDKVQILLEKYKDIPYVTTFGGTNSIAGLNKKRYLGCIGLKGNRKANFSLYHCTDLIAVGTSLSIPAMGYDIKNCFAKIPKLYLVNPEYWTIKTDQYKKVEKFRNVNSFLDKYSSIIPSKKWLNIFKEDIQDVPGCDKDNTIKYQTKTLLDLFSDLYGENFSCVADAGSVYYIVSRDVGRYECFYNAPVCQAEMGASLPYAIGSYHANGKPVLAFTGDGSLQMNIQELGMLKDTKITLVVMDNEGYLSIRATQDKFFKKRYGTSSIELRFPDIEKLCGAYDVQYYSESYPMNSLEGSVIHLKTDPDEVIVPRVEAVKNPDGSFTSFGNRNMFPFLDQSDIDRIESEIK